MKIKVFIKKICPYPVWSKLSSLFLKAKIARIKNIFEQAPHTPAYLGWDELVSFQQKYPYSSGYGYDSYSLEKRGKERAQEILSLVHKERDDIKSFLELGCWDGMVSCALQRMGKMATGIDNRPEGFDERAVQEGVKLMQMDATHLQFTDETFDFIFSYDAFEHFTEPELVLKEAMRVLKKGGYLYLSFGPLYMSSRGQHGYSSITVPYCQFLFSKELLNDFTNTKGLKAINFSCINEWTVQDYRKLWDSYSHRLKKINYHESTCYSHLGLVRKYPSCFKSKTKYFDDLIISGIAVLFQKIR